MRASSSIGSNFGLCARKAASARYSASRRMREGQPPPPRAQLLAQTVAAHAQTLLHRRRDPVRHLPHRDPAHALARPSIVPPQARGPGRSMPLAPVGALR
jgi:hypothetical protein